ncbi:uncharacterized protein LOC127858004 isoform X1 [Dreissena polymorpha]|uniref:uncharacterized protein LOC127858004 isoform X1 n=1 Tax=Dreissena polymorpha TaxID=45954 RepID=UPI0022643B77|nr:uncharacterized protein LOC127858004 isoform X1 [Dreissena polymorpha]
MKFSWDPMQVVNISRQQKAACSRAEQRLVGLERYFSRQNQLEAYKQSSMIDKVRRRLVKLNNLRTTGRAGYKSQKDRGFPISDLDNDAYRDIGNIPVLTDRSTQNNRGEKFGYSKYPIHGVYSNRNKPVHDNEQSYLRSDCKTRTKLTKGYDHKYLNSRHVKLESLPIRSGKVDKNESLPIIPCQEDFDKLNGSNRSLNGKAKLNEHQLKNASYKRAIALAKSDRIASVYVALTGQKARYTSAETSSQSHGHRAAYKTVRFMNGADDNSITPSPSKTVKPLFTTNTRKLHNFVKLATLSSDRK